MNTVLLRTVNITIPDYNSLIQTSIPQAVQFEFEWCEQMREKIVENLLANDRVICDNSYSYENSHGCPHVVNRACRDLLGREG